MTFQGVSTPKDKTLKKIRRARVSPYSPDPMHYPQGLSLAFPFSPILCYFPSFFITFFLPRLPLPHPLLFHSFSLPEERERESHGELCQGKNEKLPTSKGPHLHSWKYDAIPGMRGEREKGNKMKAVRASLESSIVVVYYSSTQHSSGATFGQSKGKRKKIVFPTKLDFRHTFRELQKG